MTAAARRQVLGLLREQLGDAAFADFLTDVWAEHGTIKIITALPALADAWLRSRPQPRFARRAS